MKAQYFLLSSTLVLFTLGILLVFGTSSAEVIGKSLDISYYNATFKQLLYGCIGSLVAFFVYHLGYKNILNYTPYLFYGISILLLLLLIPGVGKTINGAKRWIFIGPISLQPSELMKVIAPLYFLHIHQKHSEMNMRNFYILIFKISIPLSLILLEPDNGTVFIILSSLLVLFYLCNIKSVYYLVPMLFLILIGSFAALQMPHVKNRLWVYMHPETDILGKGHQPYQAKIATGSGKFFGRGIGKSFQKLNYLPEARSDYIAAIYAEEFGFIGILFLVSLYLLFGCSGLYIATLAKELYGFYIAAIMTFLVVFQSFINLGVVSGLLPSKGTNLPFFSQGGSSLLMNCICLALILSTFGRQEKLVVYE